MAKKTDEKTDQTSNNFQDQHTGTAAKKTAADGVPTPRETSPHSPYPSPVSAGEVDTRIKALRSELDDLERLATGAGKQDYPKVLYRDAVNHATAIKDAVTVLDAETEAEARGDGFVHETPGHATGDHAHTPNATDFGGESSKLDEIPATSAVDQVARTGQTPDPVSGRQDGPGDSKEAK